MIRMKKWPAVFVAFLLMLSIATPSYAALYTTPTEKAEALSRIGILKGTSGNYLLNEKLSRSEAAAFIVRMLGKEQYILANSAQFSRTIFSDVPTTAWFAPYVGYLTNLGYLSGGTDGKFHPDSYITEKAFIKLVLCSLNYIPDLDFNWDGIYRKAVEIGLITDLYYIARTDDNVNYTRGEAVNVLYNALLLPTKGSELPLFRQLILSGEMSAEAAVSAKLMYDTINTQITEIIALDINVVTVKFNEEITEYEAVYIYRSGNPQNRQACTVTTQLPNQLVIQTGPQVPLREYTIEVVNIKDKEGNTVQSAKKSFYGFLPEKIKSSYFRISTVKSETTKTINVTFTHPVNMNAEIPFSYSIFENGMLFADGQNGELTVRKTGSDSNTVVLTLVNKTLKADSVYTLRIGGKLVSAYGANLNNGLGEEMKFVPGEGILEPFGVVSISTGDTETVKVEFNKEINPFLAQQIYNFNVTDENGVPYQIKRTAIEQIGEKKGRILYIGINGIFINDRTYKLTINNLNDATRQESIIEQIFSFKAQYTAEARFKVTGVVVSDSQTIELTFNKPLDPVSAVNISFYSLRDKTSNKISYPVKVYQNAQNPEKVRLFFSSANPVVYGNQYELRVEALLKDYTGKYLEASYTHGFYGAWEQNRVPFGCEDICPVSLDSVKLTFNREFALDENIIRTENYILEYYAQGRKLEKNPVAVIYIDEKTLVLKFDELAEGVDYSLRIVSIKDYAEMEKNSVSAIPFRIDGE